MATAHAEAKFMEQVRGWGMASVSTPDPSLEKAEEPWLHSPSDRYAMVGSSTRQTEDVYQPTSGGTSVSNKNLLSAIIRVGLTVQVVIVGAIIWSAWRSNSPEGMEQTNKMLALQDIQDCRSKRDEMLSKQFKLAARGVMINMPQIVCGNESPVSQAPVHTSQPSTHKEASQVMQDTKRLVLQPNNKFSFQGPAEVRFEAGSAELIKAHFGQFSAAIDGSHTHAETENEVEQLILKYKELRSRGLGGNSTMVIYLKPGATARFET